MSENDQYRRPRRSGFGALGVLAVVAVLVVVGILLWQRGGETGASTTGNTGVVAPGAQR